MFTDHYQGEKARLANLPYPATTPAEWEERAQARRQDKGEDAPDLLALRGGSFGNAAVDALAAYRIHLRPGSGGSSIGLRWLMCRPIF